MIPFQTPEVALRFDEYDPKVQNMIHTIRSLVYEIAKEDSRIGKITESLKWNQITFSIVSTKSRTPIRVDLFDANNLGVFVSSQTNLIEHLRIDFEDELTFSGNRGILLPIKDTLDKSSLTYDIHQALTYNLR